MTEEKSISFESAYEQLQSLLEKLNEGSLSLEESLKAFEQADKLIQKCNDTLSKAEKRVEVLLKNQQGLVLDANGSPKKAQFEEVSSQ